MSLDSCLGNKVHGGQRPGKSEACSESVWFHGRSVKGANQSGIKEVNLAQCLAYGGCSANVERKEDAYVTPVLENFPLYSE